MEKIFSEIDDKNTPIPEPTKFMKHKANKFSTESALNSNNDSNNQKRQAEEMFNDLEETEIFNKKYSPDWAEGLLIQEKKWMEKKELLDEFYNFTKNLKIQKTNRSHVIASFQKLLKDSNQNVVNCTINCINNLCLGLRKDFKESKEFIWAFLDKFKEKKEKLFKDTQICLENLVFFGSLSIECFFIEIYDYSKKEERAAIVKERICILIEGILKKTYSKDLKLICKELAEFMFKLSDDASGEVRNAALQILGLIKAKIGEQSISKVINEINNIKKKKIDEAAEAVVLDPIYDIESLNNKMKTNVNNNKKKIDNPHSSTDLPMMGFNIDIIENNIKMDIDYESFSNGISINAKNNLSSNNGIPNKPNLQKSQSQSNIGLKSNIAGVASSKNVSANNVSNKNNNNKQAQKPEDNIDIDAEDDENLNAEEVENLIKSKIGVECYNLFSDPKWEQRKNGFIQLNNTINENPILFNSNFASLFKFIKIKLKDFKENNFNILREAFIVFETIIEKCNGFTRKYANVIIKNFSDKIGDPKLKTQTQNFLSKIFEFHSPKITTSNLLKHFTKNVKGANSLKEFCIFIEKSIDDFGIGQFPVKEIVDFCTLLASNSNKDLRKAATALLCGMYKYIGEPLKRFLTEIKEATMKEINEEFSKVTIIAKEEMNKTKREVKGQGAQEDPGKASDVNLMESLFPRTDISKKITPQILKELGEGKANLKKEAVLKLEKILEEAQMRILPNGLNPLLTALKNSINDSNKSLVRLILQFYTKLLEAVGTGSKQYSKIILPGILNNLSDTQSFVREDSIKVLIKWVENNGVEHIIGMANAYLMKDNFDLRNELLNLFLNNKNNLEKCDMIVLIEGIIACLLDRNIKIRNNAEIMASEMLKYMHISLFYKILSKFKPEIANTIKSILQKYSSNNIKLEADLKNPSVNIASVNIAGNNMGINIINNNNLNQQSNTLNINNINKNINIRGISNDRMDIVPAGAINEMPNIKPIKIEEFDKNKQNHSNFGIGNNINNNNVQTINNYAKNISIPDLNSLYNTANNIKNNNNLEHNNNILINNQNIKTLNNEQNLPYKNTTGIVNEMLCSYVEVRNDNHNMNNLNSLQTSIGNNFNNPKNIKNNNILFFIEDATKPKQKLNRLKFDEEMTFPNEFLIDSYVYFLNENFVNIINENYAELGFSKNINDLKSFFSTLTQIFEKNIFKFQENLDLFLKLLLIKYSEFSVAEEKIYNIYEEILFEFIENILKIIKKSKNFLHKSEIKFIFEILLEMNLAESLKQHSNKNITSILEIEKYLETFTNLSDADQLFNFLLDFMKRKIDFSNSLSISICLNILNNFLKNKIVYLKFSDKYNFEVFQPLINIINKSSIDQNYKGIAFKDLNRIYDFLNEDNKLNLESYIKKQNLDISKFIENPKINEIQSYKSQGNQNIEDINKNKFNNLKNLKNPEQNLSIYCTNKNNEIPKKKKEENLINQKKDNELIHDLKIIQNLNTPIELVLSEPVLITQNDYQIFMDECLNKLSNKSLIEKKKAIKELESIFFNKEKIFNAKNECTKCFNNNINKIYYAIFDSLRKTVEQYSPNEVTDSLVKSICVFVLNSFLVPEAVKNLEKITLFEIYEIITELNYHKNLDFKESEKTEQKNSEKTSEEHPIKTLINKLLSKVIHSVNFTDSLCALFDLIKKYLKNDKFVAKFSICILQICNQLKDKFEENQPDKILCSILLLINEIDKDPTAFIENSNYFEHNQKIIKIVRIYLHQTISVVKEKIFDYYKKGIDNVSNPDNHLKKLIQAILRKVNGISSDANQKILDNPTPALIEFLNSNKKLNENTQQSTNNLESKQNFNTNIYDNNNTNNLNNYVTNNIKMNTDLIKTGTNNNINYNNQQFSAISVKSCYSNQINVNQDHEFKNLINSYLQVSNEGNHVESLNKKRIALHLMTFLKKEKLSTDVLKNYLNINDINYIKSIQNELILQSSEISKKRENLNNSLIGIQNNKVTDFETLMNKV